MRALTLLPLVVALGACMGGNRGLESVHQPVVANGEAHVPNCPDWSSQDVHSAARTDSNYGCASNSNLAAMIADPNDLLVGKSDPTGPEVAVSAVRAARAGGTGQGGGGNAGQQQSGGSASAGGTGPR
jgi:pilus assembly protein CpaD